MLDLDQIEAAYGYSSIHLPGVDVDALIAELRACRKVVEAARTGLQRGHWRAGHHVLETSDFVELTAALGDWSRLVNVRNADSEETKA